VFSSLSQLKIVPVQIYEWTGRTTGFAGFVRVFTAMPSAPGDWGESAGTAPDAGAHFWSLSKVSAMNLLK
jgi:hypothetical protein